MSAVLGFANYFVLWQFISNDKLPLMDLFLIFEVPKSILLKASTA